MSTRIYQLARSEEFSSCETIRIRCRLLKEHDLNRLLDNCLPSKLSKGSWKSVRIDALKRAKGKDRKAFAGLSVFLYHVSVEYESRRAHYLWRAVQQSCWLIRVTWSWSCLTLNRSYYGKWCDISSVTTLAVIDFLMFMSMSMSMSMFMFMPVFVFVYNFVKVFPNDWSLLYGHQESNNIFNQRSYRHVIHFKLKCSIDGFIF